MKVKRIFAPDMRQAMRRVREEIGPDAVIISNHRVAGGVEVVAAKEDEYEAAQAELKRNRAARPAPDRREEQIRILTGAHSHQSEQASRNAALEAELNKTRARIAEASRRMTEPEVRADRNVNRQINDEDDEDLRSILASLKARNRRRGLPPEPTPPAAASRSAKTRRCAACSRRFRSCAACCSSAASSRSLLRHLWSLRIDRLPSDCSSWDWGRHWCVS